MWVLVIEDEIRMAQSLKKGLEEEGHSALVAHDGRQGLAMAQTQSFDVIVLDIMLPGIDGFEVTRRLRAARVRTPLLMLTARDAKPDIVNGLNAGADDYLTKPFAFEEFLARLRAVARRGPVAQPVKLELRDLCLDPATHEVTRGNRRIALTRTEFKLLELFMRRAGAVVSRESIIEAIWGFDESVENNTVDAFIKLLRGKIDNGHSCKLLHTVRGFGYSLRESCEV
ncbi:MAG TPA: response regulator transcription factor [Bryobacteraceae bacterium]|nr:response regulator transcription factor [Bryobacteraceae bacterium]